MDATRFQTHPVLGALLLSNLEEVLRHCTQLPLSAGTTLLTAGSENAQLYFLIEGELGVQLPGTDGQNQLLLLPGEIVGEMSVIEGKPAGATVVATMTSLVLAMPSEIFWEMFCAHAEGIRAVLTNLVLRMRRTNTKLQEAFEQKLRLDLLQRELESAARVQLNILPPASSFATLPGWKLDTLFKPARSVGGDFYDVLPLDEDRVAICIGDVSGKGMPAALFMVRVVTALRVLFAQKTPAELLLPSLNDQLCKDNDEVMFVTLAIVIVDRRRGVASYLNAGHNPLFFIRSGAAAEIWDAPKGTLLGAIPEGKFAVAERPFEIGDSVVLYTDGISEAENQEKSLFGIERTLVALQPHAGVGGDGPELGRLFEALSHFVDGASQSDDITAVFVRRVS